MSLSLPVLNRFIGGAIFIFASFLMFLPRAFAEEKKCEWTTEELACLIEQEIGLTISDPHTCSVNGEVEERERDPEWKGPVSYDNTDPEWATAAFMIVGVAMCRCEGQGKAGKEGTKGGIGDSSKPCPPLTPSGADKRRWKRSQDLAKTMKENFDDWYDQSGGQDGICRNKHFFTREVGSDWKPWWCSDEDMKDPETEVIELDGEPNGKPKYEIVFPKDIQL